MSLIAVPFEIDGLAASRWLSKVAGDVKKRAPQLGSALAAGWIGVFRSRFLMGGQVLTRLTGLRGAQLAQP